MLKSLNGKKTPLKHAEALRLSEKLALESRLSSIPEQWTEFAFRYDNGKEKFKIKYYPKKSVLVFDGKGGEFYNSIVEKYPELKAEEAERLTEKKYNLKYPCAGTDESGKGDYFGPLCTAGVMLREDQAEILYKAGIVDSKLINSRRGITEAATMIKKTVDSAHIVISMLVPKDYNRRYEKIRNLNTLLAEEHGNCFRTLLKTEKPAFCIADKFAAEEVINRFTSDLQVNIFQETKAEKYTAVAAASILAREACLEWFKETESSDGLQLQRGASSPLIKKTARKIYAAGGTTMLAKYAKLHFSITPRISQV